jgi:hypothetical protein
MGEQVIRQGFKQPKPKAVEQSRKIVVACVAASGPEGVFEHVSEDGLGASVCQVSHACSVAI